MQLRVGGWDLDPDFKAEKWYDLIFWWLSLTFPTKQTKHPLTSKDWCQSLSVGKKSYIKLQNFVIVPLLSLLGQNYGLFRVDGKSTGSIPLRCFSCFYWQVWTWCCSFHFNFYCSTICSRSFSKVEIIWFFFDFSFFSWQLWTGFHSLTFHKFVLQ